MKWWLRYVFARIHGAFLRMTGQCFKNAITVRELVSKMERDPEMRWHLTEARKRLRSTNDAKGE